ncbi:MAG: hypothetical protein JZU47_00480 [Prolixibacteraceae bacterium]|nr:hypothetical protein [Prolixibacteraceae bacterium]
MKVVFFIVFLQILGGCEYVGDPIDPRLPMYSTTGENFAGAYINKDIWMSEVPFLFSKSVRPTFTHFTSNDSLVLKFFGTSINDYDIEFHLKSLNINNYSELPKLNNQKITLDGKQNAAALLNDSLVYSGGMGQIYFTNSVASDSPYIINVSGTFGFHVYDADKKQIEVTFGRFDFTFDRKTFYTKN